MSPAVFIDANVPIYAAGTGHPYREPCARILRMAAAHPRSFVSDVEVLQELMHRYRASGRWTLGREVLQAFAQLMHDRIEPVYEQDLTLAAQLADLHSGVSSRDLVHAAVMRRVGSERVISADTDFDDVRGLIRLDPLGVEEWGGTVLAPNGG